MSAGKNELCVLLFKFIYWASLVGKLRVGEKSRERIAVQKCKRLRRDGGDWWIWGFGYGCLDWRALRSVAGFGGIGVVV